MTDGLQLAPACFKRPSLPLLPLGGSDKSHGYKAPIVPATPQSRGMEVQDLSLVNNKLSNGSLLQKTIRNTRSN